MLLPANVAGMSIRIAGEPLTVLVLSLYLFRAIGSSPIPSTSVYVDARVTRVVQHAHSARSSRRSFVGSARRGRAPRCQPHRKQSPWAADYRYSPRRTLLRIPPRSLA